MVRSLSDRKVQEWRQRLIRFEKSQHTISEFCRQEDVSPQSFFLWRKRLAKQRAAQPPDAFRPVNVLSMGGVSVQLPGGTQPVVPTTDVQSLQLVIETLARVDANRLGDARPC